MSKKNKIIIQDDELSNVLFDYQRDLIKWALKIGKSAIFADTGLGKTFIQLEWARIVFEKTNKPVLIVAPLAVAFQTIDESKKLNVNLRYVKNQNECFNGINITNYERIENFNSHFF